MRLICSCFLILGQDCCYVSAGTIVMKLYRQKNYTVTHRLHIAEQLILNENIVYSLKFRLRLAPHEKCPYSEFFWSVFSRVWSEYGEIPPLIQSECGKIRTRKIPNMETFHAVLFLESYLLAVKEPDSLCTNCYSYQG